MRQKIIIVICFGIMILGYLALIFDALGEKIFDEEYIVRIEPDSIQKPRYSDFSSEIIISGWLNSTGTAKLMVTYPDGRLSNQTMPLSKDGNFYNVILVDKYSQVGKYLVEISNNKINSQSEFVVWEDVENTISILNGASRENCEAAKTCFEPVNFVGELGTIVRWQNLDTAVHALTSEKWESEPITPGGQFELSLDKIEKMDYSCRIHPWMKGTIQVEMIQKDLTVEPDLMSSDMPGNPLIQTKQSVESEGWPKMSLVLPNQTLAQSDVLKIHIGFTKAVSNTVYLTIIGKNINLHESIYVSGVEGEYKLSMDGKSGNYQVIAQTQFGGDIQTLESVFSVSELSVVPENAEISTQIEEFGETIQNITNNPTVISENVLPNSDYIVKTIMIVLVAVGIVLAFILKKIRKAKIPKNKKEETKSKSQSPNSVNLSYDENDKKISNADC